MNTIIKRTRILVTPLLVAPLVMAAQAPEIAPGEYVYEGGRGRLIIKRDAVGKLSYDIGTNGSNLSLCELAGTMEARRARLENDGRRCDIEFKPTSRGIDVLDAGAGCSDFCGARASFSGSYVRPTPGCSRVQIDATLKSFKAAYDGKQYVKARGLLEPVLTRCHEFMRDWDLARVRNDLAITHHHLGDRNACQSVLAPLVPLARLNETELIDRYPPSDATIWSDILKATRFNSGLCGAPITPKPE